MNIEKLFSQESTIKISVVKFDNKKFTKSIFNQINRKSPFDNLYNLKENVIFLGYINDKKKWIIWKNTDLLFKYEIENLYPITAIDLHKNTIDELMKIYPSEQVKSTYHSSRKNEFAFEHRNDEFNHEHQKIKISSVLDETEQSQILQKKVMIQEIINEVLKRQIFL